jgi:polyhydroxybutyrate depolymerase
MTSRRRLTALAVFALAGLVVVSGCSGADNDAETAATATATAAVDSSPIAATPRADANACDGGALPDRGDSRRTLRAGGLDRTYSLHVPPEYDGIDPLALVLNLHGFGSSGAQQAAYSGFPALADEENFLVVSPDGAGTPRQWNIRRQSSLPDDVAFIGEMLDALERELCIDHERVFVAGMSNGAAFSQQLACAMPGRFVAVAAVTALVYPLACGSDLPVAIIAFHGTEDVCVPFDGGPVTCGSARGAVPSVEESAQNWARHNGCSSTASRARITDHVRTIAYSECDEETAVVVFVIEGGGHTWPGATPVGRLGPTTQEVDATEQIWQFFVAQASLSATGAD